MKQENGHDRRLPAQRAFVVQLAATAEVVSGQAAPFASLEDLLAFMARVLRQRRHEG